MFVKYVRCIKADLVCLTFMFFTRTYHFITNIPDIIA